MSDQEKRIQEAITLFQAGRKYSKHGTIKINLNEDGYDVVLSALNEKLQRERQEPESKSRTIFGYEEGQLALIATLMNQHGVTPDDVKRAADNFITASQITISAIAQSFDDAVKKQFPATEPKGEHHD